MIEVRPESPLSADGRDLIAQSQRHLESVFPPDGIFTMTAEELDNQARVFLVAREGGRVLGCVALVEGRDPGGESYGEVKRLMVLDQARGKGVARALMAAFEAEARAAGLSLGRIETGPELVPAVALYRALGYRDRGPFGDYAPHPSSLFMEKRLVHSGRCLCGKVTWRAEAPPLRQRHCHCESCRRATSSPMTSFVDFADGAWSWTGAKPAFYASSANARRAFCPDCGSPLAYLNAVDCPGEIHFLACSQIEPADYRPEGHDFWEEHLPWLELSDRLPR